MCPVECLDCCGTGGEAAQEAEGSRERERERGSEGGGADYMSSAAAFSSLLDYLSKFYGKHKRLKHKKRKRNRGEVERGLHLMPDLQPGWGPRR